MWRFMVQMGKVVLMNFCIPHMPFLSEAPWLLVDILLRFCYPHPSGRTLLLWWTLSTSVRVFHIPGSKLSSISLLDCSICLQLRRCCESQGETCAIGGVTQTKVLQNVVRCFSCSPSCPCMSGSLQCRVASGTAHAEQEKKLLPANGTTAPRCRAPSFHAYLPCTTLQPCPTSSDLWKDCCRPCARTLVRLPHSISPDKCKKEKERTRQHGSLLAWKKLEN